MELESRVQKTVAKAGLRRRKSDFAFWQSQPPQARIDALEEIRREFHRWKYHALPRLQRVRSIVKR